MVQITMVSMKVPIIAIAALLFGIVGLGDWRGAIAVEPWPRLVENSPRATPARIARISAAPANPPLALWKLKAPAEKSAPKVSGQVAEVQHQRRQRHHDIGGGHEGDNLLRDATDRT